MSDPKQVKFPVWDQETDEIIELSMDEGDYQAMVEYEEQMEFERKERRERLRKEEHAALRLDRDD